MSTFLSNLLTNIDASVFNLPYTFHQHERSEKNKTFLLHFESFQQLIVLQNLDQSINCLYHVMIVSAVLEVLLNTAAQQHLLLKK